ncbi:hypothetical protein ACIQ1D_13845 [Lysinibacillus xylanilyticus]|uniref:hypothetical protein n=1 Tax=Lysinibacillus xylanilyticus TaxID=582475 RepID=UPI003828C946
MVINLHTTQSPVSRSERMKINENWQKIIEGLSRLQYQINVLAGGKEVEDLLQRIEDAINNAYTSVAAAIEENNDATQEAINNVNISLEEALEKTATAIQEINTAITNANEATTNADQATSNANTAAQMANDKVTEATQMIESLASLKTQLEQIKQQLLAVNKDAEIAITNANNAALETRNAIQDTNTAITNAEVATQHANQAVQDINVVKDNLTQTVNDKITEADTAITNANHATDQAKQAAENVKGWGTATVWSATTQYEKNNIVTNNGSTWQSLTTNINSVPSESNTDWILLAQRGVDGTGSVSKVASKSPDVDGNVSLIPADIGAETPHGAQEKANGIKEWVQAHGLGTDKPGLIASPDSLLNKTESGFWNVKNLPGSTVLPNDTEDFHVYVGMKADETSNQMYQTLLAISQKTAKTYTRVITKDGQTEGQIDDSGWIEGGGSGSKGLKISAVPYDLATTEENQKSWHLPENSYVKNNDFIIVFHNGFYLSPISWNISGDAINGYTLNIPDNPIREQIENNVRIIIFNNVPIDGTERFSGNLLEDGTVSIKKLGKEVQDAISNAGEKVEIVNDLTTGGAVKVLSAGMGVELKRQIDAIPTTYFSSSLTLDDETKAATAKAAKKLNDEKVAKTGDTMTGDLVINKTRAMMNLQTKSLDGTVRGVAVRNRADTTNNSGGGEILANGAVALLIESDTDIRFKDTAQQWSSLQDLKQSVVDGKKKVAAAITTKGVTTAADATFDTMVTNIGKISTGVAFYDGNIVSSSGGQTFDYSDGNSTYVTYFVAATFPFKPRFIIVGTGYNNIADQTVISFQGDGTPNNQPYSAKVSSYNGNMNSSSSFNLRTVLGQSGTDWIIQIPVLRASLNHAVRAFG